MLSKCFECEIKRYTAMILSTRKILHCFWKALVDTIYQDGIEHAGYLAFLALLALFPFLVFIAALTGFIGESAIGTKFISLMLANLPPEVTTALKPRMVEIASGPPQGLLTLAIVGAIWTSSSAVEGLRTILNRAYRVATPPAYIWRRLVSIAQIFILTGIIVVTMSALVFVPVVWRRSEVGMNIEEVLSPVWTYMQYATITSILFIVVATFYFIIPNIKQTWKSVAPGALVVVVGWIISGMLLSSYLSHFNQVNVIYGSLGGIIVALLFFYIVSMVFIYGAEFNYHIERSLGHRIEPKEIVLDSTEIKNHE